MSVNEDYDVFATCKPMIVTTLSIDEMITRENRWIRIGGPGYHMSWISKPYKLSRLDIVSYINHKDRDLFIKALEDRGGNPILIETNEPTARIILDYTTGKRKVYFKHEPPYIGQEALEVIEKREPALLVISPIYGELPIETLKEIAGRAQWSVLDLQGYLRIMSPDEIASVFPKRIVDVVHLSSDDISQRKFDALLDEIAGISRHSLLYTLGPEGAVLIDSNGNPRLRARPKEVSPSPGIGCGDVFTLSYSLFLCATWEPRKAFIEALMTSMYYALKPPIIHEYTKG
jgi:sugar/nucleoside kinase (ribokinase family)